MEVPNSKFIRNRQLKINLGAKKEGSGSVYGICVVCIMFVIFLSSIFLYRTTSNYHYKNIDNALTDALLAGCVVDIRSYISTGKIEITENPVPTDTGSSSETYVAQSYGLFKDSLSKNIPLIDGSDQKKEYFNFKVTKYIIFNVNGNDITAYVFTNPESSSLWTKATGLSSVSAIYNTEEDKNLINLTDGTIRTSDGYVKVNKTCVYAEAEFTLNTAPSFEWLALDERQGTYKLARCIAITR